MEKKTKKTQNITKIHYKLENHLFKISRLHCKAIYILKNEKQSIDFSVERNSLNYV